RFSNVNSYINFVKFVFCNEEMEAISDTPNRIIINDGYSTTPPDNKYRAANTADIPLAFRC
ncbi:hypothetical protein, partial [Erwinia amylovora]